MKKYNLKFDEIKLFNRWNFKYPPNDWTVIGIEKWVADTIRFRISLCFLGFRFDFWLKKIKLSTEEKSFDEILENNKDVLVRLKDK